MKRLAALLLLIGLTFLSGLTLSGSALRAEQSVAKEFAGNQTQEAWSEGHCTIIYAANDEIALGGGNEDWDDPTARVRFVPAEDGKYGIVYFGFANSAYEAGMNDQGLFFDAAATSPLEVVDSLHKISSGGYPVKEVMETSATVEEALAVFNRYNLAFMEDFQLLFGDSQGNSAILEGDEVIYKDGRYQIMTNFYQSQLPEGILPGRRYRTAQRMFEAASTISIGLFKLILDATHQEGQYPTQYSNIYDLTHRKVYVFYLHDYERVIEIDLARMLAQGARTYELSAIFETVFDETTPAEAVPEQAAPATPTPAVLETEDHDSDNYYFWLGIVPPLVVLILILGGRVRHLRNVG